MECARDRGSRQGQYINSLAETLEIFFVDDAEALFFINNDKAEVFEVDIAGEQAMKLTSERIPNDG